MKILVLYAATGGGHLSAARAIREEAERRGHICDLCDAFSFMPRAKREILVKGHTFVYRHAPTAYGIGYRLEEKNTRAGQSMYSDYSRYAESLCGHIRDGQYDAVICVHVFAALMMTGARRTCKLDVRQYFVATDYTCSPGVDATEMDAWFVPVGLKGEFSEKVVPSDNIVETGIPVSAECLQPTDKAQARSALGLSPEKRLVLISTGSMGCGPVPELVQGLLRKTDGNTAVAVLCGSNAELREELEALHEERLTALPFTDKARTWIKAADVVITKPGGLTSTEVAVCGTPMVLTSVVPGPETYNLEHFVSEGCAVAGNETEDILSAALALLNSPSACARMRTTQHVHYSMNSAALIVDCLEAQALEPAAPPAAETQTVSQLAREVTENVFYVTGQLYQYIDDASSGVARLLNALARAKRPLSLAELSRGMNMSPSRTSVLVRALTADALIRRENCPADGRRPVYSLTEAGWERIDSILRRSEKYVEQIVERVGAGEMARYVSIGGEIRAAMEALAEESPAEDTPADRR